MEHRKRLSRSSEERHTSQLQAMTGTPCEVPVPKTVILIFNFGFSIGLLQNFCSALPQITQIEKLHFIVPVSRALK
jgi:hypothetical protein